MVRVEVFDDTPTCLNAPLRRLVPPPPTADDVLEPLHVGHGHRNIMAWRVMIGKDAALTEHLV